MASPKTPQPAEKPATETTGTETAIIDQMAMSGLHLHMDQITAHLEQLHTEVRGPVFTAHPDDVPQPKPLRRRSQDEMEAALRRLLSPEMRPQDDDSPQVVQDAFAEVIYLRQLTHDLMQTLTSGYQHGLAAIRDMTSR
jgi:hypothetical protein